MPAGSASVSGDVVVALLALVAGAAFCFRGYLAMRLVIPVWGAFVGLLVGAGVVASVTDQLPLSSLAGWVAGLAGAFVFAALAYTYFEVSVLLGLAAVGFTLGAALLVALGVEWSWLVVLGGAAVGALVAAIGLVGDLPMVLLTLLTALAGAQAMVVGLMLLSGVLSVSDLGRPTTTATVDDGWWWALSVVLVVTGVVVQLRATDRRRSLRQTRRMSPAKVVER